jgi:hypothetical protein
MADDGHTHLGEAFGVESAGLAKAENCYMHHCDLSLP